MAESPLRIEYEYFPDPTRGRPVSNGAVYVGVENTDPTVLGNRVDVVLIQQDGTRVTIQPNQQPFSTTPGGVIEYLGSPAIIRVDGAVAIAVDDSVGNQVYYNPLANQSGGTGGAPGVSTSTTGIPLNGSFEVETVAGQADNWTYAAQSNGIISVDGTNQAHGFKSLGFLSGSAAGAGTATSDRFNVLSSGKIDLRFSLKSTSANVLNTVSIRYYDSVGTILTINTVFSDGAANPVNFAPYIVNDLAPSGAIEAEIILTGVSSGGATTAGTTWFDDVALATNTGTFEVGDTGSIIQTTDVPGGVNKIGASNAIAGQPPTIDQLGPDDLGVLIEQVLIKNGIITGDLTGNADTVTTIPVLSGDVSNAGNVITVNPVSAVENETVGSLAIKKGTMNVISDDVLPGSSFVNITEIGLIYVSTVNNGFSGESPLTLVQALINGRWTTLSANSSNSSTVGGGAFVYSNGANVRVFNNNFDASPTYSVDKIED